MPCRPENKPTFGGSDTTNKACVASVTHNNLGDVGHGSVPWSRMQTGSRAQSSLLWNQPAKHHIQRTLAVTKGGIVGEAARCQPCLGIAPCLMLSVYVIRKLCRRAHSLRLSLVTSSPNAGRSSTRCKGSGSRQKEVDEYKHDGYGVRCKRACVSASDKHGLAERGERVTVGATLRDSLVPVQSASCPWAA